MKKVQIIAVTFAFVIFVIGYLSLSGNSSKVENNTKEVEVVVANQVIEAETIITADMVELQSVVLSEDDTDYYENIDDVVNGICTITINANETLTSDRLISAEEVEKFSLASKIEPGKRAITIEVDTESSMNYNIKEGDYVDLLYFGELDDSNIPGGTTVGDYSDIVMNAQSPKNSAILHDKIGLGYAVMPYQNLKVLVVGSTESISSEFINVTMEGLSEYMTVTLEVTPEQATGIMFLNKSGEIAFSLRAPNDNEIVPDVPRQQMLLPKE